MRLEMRHGCLAYCHHLLYKAGIIKPNAFKIHGTWRVGSMEFEKESSAKSHSNSITKQNQTKTRQNKTKITGLAKQNICRPDLVCSL